MKTRAGSIPVHLCVLLALAISVVVVAASITPSTAHARPRLENTSPLQGDPDGPEQSPSPTIQKAARVTVIQQKPSSSLNQFIGALRLYSTMARMFWRL